MLQIRVWWFFFTRPMDWIAEILHPQDYYIIATMGGRAVISISLFTKHITLSDSCHSCHSSCRHPGMERELTVEFPQSYSIWGVFVRTRRRRKLLVAYCRKMNARRSQSRVNGAEVGRVLRSVVWSLVMWFLQQKWGLNEHRIWPFDFFSMRNWSLPHHQMGLFAN